MGLEIDHVFCFVAPDDGWLERAQGEGWTLDDGIEHEGQGTRNRRLWFAEQYLELLWISSREDAERNPLRLDRRADWRTTGACPFGIGLRGLVTDEQRAVLGVPAAVCARRQHPHPPQQRGRAGETVRVRHGSAARSGRALSAP